ncbi:MAG: YbaK/EbsC family protein [Candidatus Tectomicrobia bacterium]|uniref:YbaK/EbsC family protein n=1 Tax=Tectimicrobiota bacterium TaxID=2528274 RepID=A0A932CNL2_UNCTE|nr:YbaK/EbsC family protein [Candidatus Tectomicrobia bacterium]
MPARRLRQFLDENQVEYTSYQHQEAYTAQELAAVQHIPGREWAKSVIVKTGRGRFIMVVAPASYMVDLNRLQALLGEEVRLATEEEFKDLFPDCDIGAMPPFGNLYHLDVYVDESLKRDEYITFNACTHNESIRMKYADFERLIHPKVGRLASKMAA